jgi:hypothetical protein
MERSCISYNVTIRQSVMHETLFSQSSTTFVCKCSIGNNTINWVDNKISLMFVSVTKQQMCKQDVICKSINNVVMSSPKQVLFLYDYTTENNLEIYYSDFELDE